jgi:hypothetical protein
MHGGVRRFLAETRFGFLAATFFPTTPRTQKELGFRAFIPFRVPRCYRLGLETPASWRNGISDYRTSWLKPFGLTDFFGGHIFRQFKSLLLLHDVNFLLGQYPGSRRL